MPVKELPNGAWFADELDRELRRRGSLDAIFEYTSSPILDIESGEGVDMQDLQRHCAMYFMCEVHGLDFPQIEDTENALHFERLFEEWRESVASGEGLQDGAIRDAVGSIDIGILQDLAAERLRICVWRINAGIDDSITKRERETWSRTKRITEIASVKG